MSETENDEVMREKANAEYLAKLKRSDEDYKAGRIVVKTLDELKAMEDSMPCHENAKYKINMIRQHRAREM